MKRFLLRDPANIEWFQSQEKRKKVQNDASEMLNLVRREMFPQLNIPKVELLSAPILKELSVEAKQRSLYPTLMNELLAKFNNHKGKKTTKVYKSVSWEKKSYSIFFYLHPLLGKENLELTCLLFSHNVFTFKNWVTQQQYFGKWASFVQSMSVKDVLNKIPEDYQSNYSLIDLESKLKLPKKFLNEANRVYLSAAGGSRHKKFKKASKTKDLKYISKSAIRVGGGRHIKYLTQELFIVDAVVSAWECGNPLTKQSAYDLLISKFGHEKEIERTEWEKKMAIHSGSISPALSQWVTRTLKRYNFSIRKESISQSVPKNWLNICFSAAKEVRDIMSNAKVTRLVSADEMFLQFYPKDHYLIAPTNIKRVGSNRKEDEKQGCTVMLGCEMFTSKMIAPFVVMTGTRSGTLSRKFSNWEGASKVTFHPKHWMDKNGCCDFLEWLNECFKGEKIGLIWDAATCHRSEQVLEKARDLNITIGEIPPGCTSLLQICDLIVNKPVKQEFKKKYTAWKIRQDPGPGEKYKVEREDVIYWLEEAVKDFDKSSFEARKIQKAFEFCGQDFTSSNTELFENHLAKYQENGIYKALLDTQTAVSLE